MEVGGIARGRGVGETDLRRACSELIDRLCKEAY